MRIYIYHERKRTFLLWFPPPDFAGFDDGGGTLSFFGACNKKYEIIVKIRERRNIDLLKEGDTMTETE